MSDHKEHGYIPALKAELSEGRIDRREFLRTAVLLGIPVVAAFGMAGGATPLDFVSPAQAAPAKGGVLRISMSVMNVSKPHALSQIYGSNIARQVFEYLTVTESDNFTRPYLLERWEASDDLKTWKLFLRKDVTWRDGRKFVADDVIWNLQHVLDPATGSSVLGMMSAYMLEQFATGKKDASGKDETSYRLWSPDAIQKIDDYTVQLNLKAPQLALPEHLFHYSLPMIDPQDNGEFKVGSNATGAFELVSIETNKKAVLKANPKYWGEGPYLDGIEFIDPGSDPSAGMAALLSKQVHGIYAPSYEQVAQLSKVPTLKKYNVTSASTGVVRGKCNQKPFDDPRVRKALRLSIDSQKVVDIAIQGQGVPAEHHQVAPVHPEYAKLNPWKQDIEQAKALLAAAGYPDGLDLEITVQNVSWESLSVQAMVQQWKQANIRVKINVIPSSVMDNVWNTLPFSHTAWAHRPLGTMVLGLVYRKGAPWNESEYDNPEFEKLLNEAEGLLDVDKRRKVMAKIEQLMQDDGPIIQTIWMDQPTFMHETVQGFTAHPTRLIFGNRLSLAAA